MSTSKKNITNKSNITLHLRAYWHIYATFILVILVSGILAWLYRHQINPDGISYIQVAREYAGLHLKTAINGYWSPLLSWLLVPFIWIGVDPLLAFRFINLSLVLGIIGGLLYIVNRLKAPPSRTIQFMFASSLGLTFGTWATTIVTPDILSGTVLLVTFGLLYQYLKTKSLIVASALGTSLALLYLSKSIGLYMAIAIVGILALYEFRRFKRITRPTIIATAIFAIICTIWIGLISVKYETLTISTAGNYNLAMQGPTHPSHPIALQGSLETHSSRAIWAWDDPSYFKLPTWSILENIPYYLGHVAMMTGFTITYVLQLSPLFLLGALAFFVTKKDRPSNLTSIGLAATSLIVLAIYSLLYVESRYLWIIAIPIMTIGGLLFAQQKLPRAPTLGILGVIFAATLFSTIPMIRDGLEVQFYQSNLKHFATESQAYVGKYAHMAGDNVFEYCYFSTTQCTGNYMLTGKQEDDQPIIDKMRREDIQYYVSLSDKSYPYMNPIYHSKSQPNPLYECFDALSRRYRDCKEVELTIYKL